jgi:ketosteroid isomerase-like protein
MHMTAEQNIETVRQGYAAFSSGDMESLMRLYRPDAAHLVPGSSPVSGAHKGHAGIQELYGDLFERSNGTMTVELEHVLSDGGNRVIAIHRGSVEKDGEVVTTTDALLFTFADGKIAEIQDFVADIAANDALWS